MADRLLEGHIVVEGTAQGPLLAADEPLSFWGGYDSGTGRIIDRTHAFTGQHAAGAILAIPETRGSSTTTAVLLESVRQGNAPAGIVTRGTDAFLALASIVAEELYGKGFPVVSVDDEGFAEILGAAGAEILPGGQVRLD